MHRRTILGLVVTAATLGAAAPSFAQPHDRDRDRGPQHEEHHEGPRERSGDRGHGQWERDVRGPDAMRARGPEWHRGGHLPPAYRDHAYVVNNWREHRLPPPPRGYQWVQVGPDFVLVVIRTGVIAQIVIG